MMLSKRDCQNVSTKSEVLLLWILFVHVECYTLLIDDGALGQAVQQD